ncbi:MULTISPECIES: hypothetical protein [Grimontia]|uniref:hypothetical protein n=1 Tax=Grimontia TaxID=246861 RepID=UPI00058712E6|nr:MULTISPECIES: hypothetical protein [Grimontia]
MFYLPKWFAQKFAYFKDSSILSIWLTCFAMMILFAVFLPLITSISDMLFGPAASILLLCFLGMMSAKYFARKKIILTGPIAVRVAASDAGETAAKIGKTISDIFFLLFFYFWLFSCLFIALSPLLFLALT